MKERLEKETKKADMIGTRRKLELEGYGSDLQNMKRKIDFYQRYISKLKSLVDEEAGGDLYNQMQDHESQIQNDLDEVAEQDEEQF